MNITLPLVAPLVPRPLPGAGPEIPPVGILPSGTEAAPGIRFTTPPFVVLYRPVPPPVVANFSLAPTLGEPDDILNFENQYRQQLHKMITKLFPTKFN